MNKANECTCPSGDGSLVHPCPAHPAVEQSGTNVGHGHVFPRADGVKMRCGGPGLCSECTADASRARAALAQPSPKCATCNDSGQIVVSGPHYQGEFQPPEYETEPCDMCAQPSPAQAEQAEAERPEVVAYFDRNYPSIGDAFIWSNYEGSPYEPVMTVSQHERIVGELRADRDSWEEQAEQRLADWDEMRKERDAALARVAELERQEPVALANRGLHAFWVKWTEAAAGLYGPGIKLYAAPVAQAQQLNDLDKQCRDDVARALGLRPNQERGFAWSYLLASIKSCVKASGDSAQAQHSGPGKYDEVLLPFLKSMEHELHANAGKGDRPGWLQMDRKTALLEIYYHLGKLQKATKGNDTAGIVEYAADVANMSMMLVDVCGLLAAAPGKEGV